MFKLYKVFSDELDGFRSCELAFVRVNSKDQALYKQVTDNRNKVTRLEILNINKEYHFLDINAFEKLIGDTQKQNVDIGLDAMFCFADVSNLETAFLFSTKTKLPKEASLTYLSTAFTPSNLGSILDFITRKFNENFFVDLLNSAIHEKLSPEFIKKAIYSYICSANIVSVQQALQFRKSATVCITEKRAITIEISQVSEILNLSPLVKFLYKITKTAITINSITQEDDTSETDTKTNLNPSASKENPKLLQPRPVRKFRTKRIKSLLVSEEGITGGEISTLRKKLGLSRLALAEYLGVSSDRVRRWETKFSHKNINFQSAKLESLKSIELSKGQKDVFWDIVVSTSRRKKTSELMRFFESNPLLVFAFEISFSDLQLTYLVANPYSNDFQQNSILDELQTLGKSQFNEESIGQIFSHMKEHKFNEYSFLTTVSSDGYKMMFIAIPRDYKDHWPMSEVMFSKLFGRRRTQKGDPVIAAVSFSHLPEYLKGHLEYLNRLATK